MLQGDGGTRTASVTGGFIALSLACRKLVEDGVLAASPIVHSVTAVSAGIVEDELLLDLQYSEDSHAQVDLNCVMNELGEIVEVQGTGEGRAFTLAEQQDLLRLCAKGCRELRAIQRKGAGGLSPASGPKQERRTYRHGTNARGHHALLLRGILALQHRKIHPVPDGQGQEPTFEVCIIVGYLFGVAGKIVSGNVTYVLVFYIVDILMVVTDLVLTLRNQRLDREEERRAKA